MSGKTRDSLQGAADHEIYRRRGRRNLALGGVLLALVLLIFAVTIVKLSEGIDMRGYDHTFETVPGSGE